MARNINEVIDRVLPLIPADREFLREQLTKVKQDSGFKPPEGQYLCWQEASELLEDEVGAEMALSEPPEWVKKVSAIWTGRA